MARPTSLSWVASRSKTVSRAPCHEYYHHVKDGTPYPAVLFETGMNDPRLDPWQMAKMAARLQAATSSGKPVLLRVDQSKTNQVVCHV